MQQSLTKSAASSGFAITARRFWGQLATWWEVRATIRTLRELDAHALRDIGIDRHDIEQVARSHSWPQGH